MYNNNVKPKGRFGRRIESLRFNWTRRRYIWRASFFYSLVSWVLLLGIVLTLLFHILLRQFSFFVNYSCSARSIKLINGFILSIIITTGILVILSIFLAKICNIFSNYTMSHFMETGNWLKFLGCTVKWFPWIFALFMWIWLAFQLSSLIWIFVGPKQWCVNRFDEMAVNAVKNCRLILKRMTPCQITLENTYPKEIRSCNDPDYLIQRKMILMALKDPSTKCTIEDLSVCNAYRDAMEKEDFKWDEPALSGCYGTIPTDMSDFIDEKNTSDLFKYILLSNISWSITFVVIVCLFYFIKSVTKFDAIIYQPKDPSDNLVIKIVRPFTPWTR
ncbi:hypothetical protein MACK_003398 [Theileria orientalis]|uniref:Uncharacterized protein n=1 Tax=Theileria orientalis TaxID=68886 RepID=A0A976XJP1_THEOR|nr:hypothetical protein MACK_003398 [Theileria orientalis]